ncbi:polyphosphate polymerase domain-containing protein [Aggregatimonas sangjinii]|uniref:Polyphosphate polymerase domain-containing protein n=1 Tax=Aggregatimonas sangjinii TaxID=2583587 RepID=A0A5B7SNF2_9FLAO|nr:polyphosphate polymerase domain-containing protein [Aggregatimonas sangjinii]QCX00047.1 polyphosphate polymerase domain-containing protein [Aggregatimonas sangjinii]
MQILNSFDSVDLKEINAVSLMDRVDTKFIFHMNELEDILGRANDDYSVLQIGGSRQMGYSNQYFDTHNLKFYTDHHNGKLFRTKIRIRRYDDTDLVFLEVKHKSNKGRMNKIRAKIPEFRDTLSEKAESFLSTQLSTGLNIVPTIRNNFQRVTLVGRNERITFDTNLTFQQNGSSVKMGNLVIAEIKQAELNRSSPLFTILKEKKIKPYRISKYCIGMASLYDGIKKNRFKEKLNKIKKITA